MRPTIKTLVTDWIQLTCEGIINLNYTEEYTEHGGELALRRLGYGNRNFAQIVEVFFEGRLFGTMQINPNKPSWNPSMVIFQLENSINYETGKISMLEGVLKNLGLKYKNVTRLDVAGDGLSLLQPLQKVYEGKIARIGSALMTARTKSDNSIHHVRLGTKKSKRSMIGYNKSKELNRSGKAYIKHFWQKSGVDEKYIEKDMERIEFSFRSDWLKKIGDTKLSSNGTVLSFKSWFPEGDFSALYKLEDSEFLKRLFLTASKRMYEFIKKGEPNVARAKRLYTLHVNWLRMELLPRLKAVASKQVKTIKQMTKQMYFAYKHTRARHYLQLAAEISSVNHLELWMQNKLEHWDREYKVNNRKKRLGWVSNFYTEIDGKQTKLFREISLKAFAPKLAPQYL